MKDFGFRPRRQERKARAFFTTLVCLQVLEGMDWVMPAGIMMRNSMVCRAKAGSECSRAEVLMGCLDIKVGLEVKAQDRSF